MVDGKQVGDTYRVGVTAHGDRDGVWLGRVPVTEVRVGDFAGIRFIGGYAHLIVRIGAIERASDGIRLVFDWNGYRDGGRAVRCCPMTSPCRPASSAGSCGVQSRSKPQHVRERGDRVNGPLCAQGSSDSGDAERKPSGGDQSSTGYGHSRVRSARV